MKDPISIRREISSEFDEIKENLDNDTIVFSTDLSRDSYGHDAGSKLEEWVRKFLLDNNWEVYYPNEFIKNFFDEIKPSPNDIDKIIQNIWWGGLLITKKQIKAYFEGKKIDRWQQEAADLILLYGDNIEFDFEKVILINVKSHEIHRASRAPNIISAQRLLEFFHNLILQDKSKDLMDKLNYWFIGIGWEHTDKGGVIKDAIIKDLFKLDTNKIPQINFDAAIQIQWHVKDMIEKEQSKEDFILNLSYTFLTQWESHSKRKGNKYKKLVTEIVKNLN